MDVVLDTVVTFGGDTTTREAFEVGAPIVTLPHTGLSSRWTQAYYRLLGVTDLIATDPVHSVDLAIRIASDRTAQADIRGRIKANLHKLFHSTKAAGAWTDALLKMAGKKASGGHDEL